MITKEQSDHLKYLFSNVKHYYASYWADNEEQDSESHEKFKMLLEAYIEELTVSAKEKSKT